MEKKVILKAGKEKPLLSRHHWIFSGALANPILCEPGQILPVYSSHDELLGHAYFNPKCSLVGRMVSFGKEDPFESLESTFVEAIQLRKSLFNEKITNGYRLINGEGDALPGLVIDKYADSLVIQIGSYGMERLKPFFMGLIQKHLPECTTVYEKSTLLSRKHEGLKDQEGYLLGTQKETIILENGIRFLIQFDESQKTGFFLDHRQMRELMGKYSSGRRVLNCFSYSGGFSLYAALNGALSITSLDLSKAALEQAAKNFALNGLPPHPMIQQDIFDFLKIPQLDYDLVVLDPPAFAKKKEDLPKAMNAYRELNRLAMQKMPSKSLLLTCSCSYHLDETLFQKILFQAASMAKRKVKILSRHLLAPDHPINLYHPESEYLKSFFLSLS